MTEGGEEVIQKQILIRMVDQGGDCSLIQQFQLIDQDNQVQYKIIQLIEQDNQVQYKIIQLIEQDNQVQYKIIQICSILEILCKLKTGKIANILIDQNVRNTE